MSGYNSIEQAVGRFLDRFPRLKGAVETVYQRVSYRLLADSGFKYDIHESTKLQRVGDAFDVNLEDCFVGFYDICPWNESMDLFLAHELRDGKLAIVVLGDGVKREVATTSAWNYQQGSRAQWHPKREGAVVFNDLDGDEPVTRVVDIEGEKLERYEGHLQAMNPTGGDFLAVDYRRYDRNSPAYGYELNEEEALADPAEGGIVRVDTDGGRELIVTIATLRSAAGGDVPQDCHYIHHSLYAPGGERFVFLHRWREGERRRTRLCVSDMTGDVREVLAHDSLSHFSWLDESRLFLWGGSAEHGRGYHIVDVDTGGVEYVEELDGFGDGHPSVSPDGEWVMTDTYPDRTRTRSLWLYHLKSDQHFRVGGFFSPFGLDGPTRCDLHPRWSRDGQYISIDSAHEGVRGSYTVDVGDLLTQ